MTTILDYACDRSVLIAVTTISSQARSGVNMVICASVLFIFVVYIYINRKTNSYPASLEDKGFKPQEYGRQAGELVIRRKLQA
jgi:hypothetical protein